MQGDVSDTNLSGPHVPGALGDYAVARRNPSTSGANWWNASPVNGTFFQAVDWETGKGIRWGRPLAEILDGTSNTIFAGEKHVRPGFLGRNDSGDGSIYNGDKMSSERDGGPTTLLARNPNDTGNSRFGSWHIGVCPFVFGDGAVRMLRNTIDGTTLGNLISINDGQVINSVDIL